MCVQNHEMIGETKTEITYCKGSRNSSEWTWLTAEYGVCGQLYQDEA